MNTIVNFIGRDDKIVTTLLNQSQLTQLFENHNQRNDKGYDPYPVVSIRIPNNLCKWLLTEIDEEGIAFGLCDLGQGFPELGYVSLEELINAAPSAYADNEFKALAPLSVYAEKAREAREIIYTWDGIDDVEKDEEVIPLQTFLNDYKAELLQQIEQQTPVVYNGQHEKWQDDVLSGLKRKPFSAQAHRIHACYAGLVTKNLPAVFLNGEMGTGKTMMGICVSAMMHKGFSQKPTLVISPPHLVYKWRREILDTVPDAAVTVINGSNAMRDLIAFREKLVQGLFNDSKPRYLIIGRVRMRMGFHWRPAYWPRKYIFSSIKPNGEKEYGQYLAVACNRCGQYQYDQDGVPVRATKQWGQNKREKCQHCQEPLWTMKHRGTNEDSAEEKLRKFLVKLPGIGKVTIDRLIETFGTEMLTNIVDDNIYDFVNLIGPDGDFYFKEKHANRLEKAMGRLEFALQMISYQPSEFVKRYFPRKAFGLALIDEAHEYKNSGSAQGQAMAVLCGEAEKVLCLTGTLMGGYASDLFYLLFRAMPSEMVKMGFGANRHNSLGTSEARFMQEYGCLIEITKYSQDNGSFSTSRAKKTTSSIKKAPGFSPMGIAQFVLPYSVFMRLSDLGEGILPAYEEETRLIPMDGKMIDAYSTLKLKLTSALKNAIANRDFTVTSVVINALLRWPETCYRAEKITHPHDKNNIFADMEALYEDDVPTPKEQDIIDVCIAEKQKGRRVIVYTTYTGKFDTASRLRKLLTAAGLKVAVLRSSVQSDAREDWINDQVEREIDVLITNPELVKTGLDLLAFPTLYFAQTGYNVYTVGQASRRSWRIGQDQDVKVYYACYSESTQKDCYELMAKKIKTSLSTMGVMPETGLDVFDEDEDSETSITQALAKTLLNRS